MRAFFLTTLCTALTLSTAARAEGQRDAFDCGALRTCVVGQPCTDGGETFGLTFLGGGLEIAMNGETLRPDYDGTMRTAAWQSGARIFQLHFTGDAGGVVTITKASGGEFDGTTVLWLHCSPA